MAQTETDVARHPPAENLAGQVAIVTGASSGIGSAVATALGVAGASVVINHMPDGDSPERAREVVQAIEKTGGRAIPFPADVTREGDVAAMVEKAVSEFGDLHIMIANAGIEKPSDFQDMSLDDWKAVIDVNLNGAFISARAAVRHFLSRQVDETISRAAGKIVFTSSVHEFIPWAFQTNYAASKGGIMLLMKSLAQEVAPMKIRVNSVAPGAIATAINLSARDTPEKLQSMLDLIPYGRLGDPKDIANAVVWLASDASDYVTGTSLVVDGGMGLYPSFRGAG